MYNVSRSASNVRGEVEVRASKYISGVYTWMSLGVLFSAVMAWALVESGMINGILTAGRSLIWIIFAAQIGAVLLFNSAVNKMSVNVSRAAYFAYAGITGVTFAIISFAYTASSIAGIFLLATFAFAGLATFGAITKKNLGPIGTFCSMGLFMLFGLAILQMLSATFGFLSSWMQTFNLTIGVLGIGIFSGLTAWESQKIKEKAYNLAGSNMPAAVIDTFVTQGAFTMYLNFINLFISLLRVFGDRR